MKVVFVNRFFYPDTSATSQMLSDLAFDLATTHDVHVVTSRLRHGDARRTLPKTERVQGVTVHRAWTSGFGRGSLLGRSVDYATFYVSAAFRLLALLRRNDIAVAMTDPPMMAIPVSLVSAIRSARLVNWLHDLFPEIATELDFKNLDGRAARLLCWFRNRSLAAARMNVVLGDVMALRVQRTGVEASRTLVIHNWASGTEIQPIDRGQNELREQWGLAGKFVVGYSGNIGRAHDFDAILDAASALLPRTDILFLFIGEGPRRAQLEAAVGRRGLTNVWFKPHQPREWLPQSLAVADCHLVTLRPALEGLVVPSKIYGSLATGRPVIFVGAKDGEIGRMLQNGPECGFCVAPDAAGRLTEIITRLADSEADRARLGHNARARFEAEFDRTTAVARWRLVLESLAS
jgi:colanic acid biosynthesis glycosyl transferase WcaI